MVETEVSTIQAEDKVFSLRQRKRNAGRFGDLAAVGVLCRGPQKIERFFGVHGYVQRRERAGVPRNARSGFWGFADEKQ